MTPLGLSKPSPSASSCQYPPDVPYEELPHGPDDDEDESQEPALHDEEGDGQHNGVGVVLDHDEELRDGDGGHEPRLLAQLLVELPDGTRGASTRSHCAPSQQK